MDRMGDELHAAFGIEALFGFHHPDKRFLP